ncbi:MAG: BatA domain-containing protein [bacterium]
MNFINPILLLFAAAASVPLLLHLFNRQRVKVVEFSTVKYLRTLQKTRLRKLRLRQILLLLLRTLILLAVAIAFARPTVEGGYFQSLGAKSTTTVVLLLDVSGSSQVETGPGSIFEREIEKARQLIATFTQKERATVIAFGSDVVANSGEPSSDFERLVEFLQELHPTGSESNPALALRKSFEILATANDPNREIYLLSDLQGRDYQELDFDLFAAEQLPVKLFLVPIQPEDVENVSLTEIEFPKQIITAGRDFELEATIANRKAELSVDLLATLEVSGRKVAQSNLALPPAGSGKVAFAQSAGRSGWLWGEVGIDDDDLLADNSYYFAMRIPTLAAIGLVTDNEREAFLIEKALAPLPDQQTAKRIGRLTPDQAAGANLFDYDVVIVDMSGVVSSALLSSLRTYMRAGGGVVWLAPENVDLKSFSSNLSEPLFGISLVEPPPTPQPETGSFQLNNFDLDHPIFSPYKDFADDKRPRVEFFSHFKTLESPKANVLARFSDRTPAVVEAQPDQGRALLFTFSLNENYSDMPLHPLAVVLLNRSIEYLVSEPLRQREMLFAGQDITRVLPAVTQQQFSLVKPNGDTLQLSPRQQTREVLFQLGVLSEPGVYLIVGDDAVVDMFAVNFPLSETLPEYLEPSELEEKVAVERFVILPEAGEPAEAIAAARFGKELWKLFLLAGFIFMLLEMALASSGRRAATEAT